MIEIIKVDNAVTIATVNDLRQYYVSVESAIQKRLNEFQVIGKGSSKQLFQELIFCILTANASAKMAMKAVSVIDDDTLFLGNEKDISTCLKGVYRFPRSRANYIVRTRHFLKGYCDLDVRKIFDQYDGLALREFLAKFLCGIGYKESSHFLRNIGFKGFAILDKHIISMLNLLGCNVQKPCNKKEYCKVELIMKDFAKRYELDFDELDLLFWSYKTGEIIK